MAVKNVIIKPEQFHSMIINSCERLNHDRIIPRIWEHDHTVWKPEPIEISNRLGWLHCPESMQEAIGDITSFADQVRREGFTQALLFGMGGSSLAPEVFRKIFGVKAGYLELTVLDSTVPGAVLSAARKFDSAKTLFIASTKSGGTIETLSFVKYFYNAVQKKIGSGTVGNHFIAITDPGSGLETLAKVLKFRKVFLNDPDIGGRFSALSYFGLVPAGLLGIDVKLLLEQAQHMSLACQNDSESERAENGCTPLGAFLGEFARRGKDKLTFIISPQIAPLGVWIEQLIAESTGKEGKGILPVVDEAVLAPEDYSDDRLFVYLKFRDDRTHDIDVTALIDAGYPVCQIHVSDLYDVGSEFFRWEMATALACHILNINPFDQPDVESAKVLARNMVAAYQGKGELPESEPSLTTKKLAIFAGESIDDLPDAMTKFLAKADSRNGRCYVAIQAFIEATTETDVALHKLRTKIQQRYHIATTIGYGPRFLHSTGQLHKGDGGQGLFIQLTANHAEDAPIPDRAGKDGSSMTFGVLALAQAFGDRQALLNANRAVIRVHINSDIVAAIEELSAALG